MILKITFNNNTKVIYIYVIILSIGTIYKIIGVCWYPNISL